jgi:hypothetical protein
MLQQQAVVKVNFTLHCSSINQLYDATIQGSLFSNRSPITFSLVPYRFNGEAGFKYRNLNLSYVFCLSRKRVVQ